MAEDDDGLNEPSTIPKQDWKVKNVCIDRVTLQVAPEMTLQAILAGQAQDVIQSMASKATQVFTEKWVTRSFSESPLLVFEQEAGHRYPNLQPLALKPDQSLSSSTRYSTTSCFYPQAVQDAPLTPEKIDDHSFHKNEMKEESIRQNARLRRCGLS